MPGAVLDSRETKMNKTSSYSFDIRKENAGQLIVPQTEREGKVPERGDTYIELKEWKKQKQPNHITGDGRMF